MGDGDKFTAAFFSSYPLNYDLRGVPAFVSLVTSSPIFLRTAWYSRFWTLLSIIDGTLDNLIDMLALSALLSLGRFTRIVILLLSVTHTSNKFLMLYAHDTFIIADILMVSPLVLP